MNFLQFSMAVRFILDSLFFILDPLLSILEFMDIEIGLRIGLGSG